MKIYAGFFAVSAILFAGTTANAQTLALKSAPATVKIDGAVSEWQGYQENENEKSKVKYIISNDKDNLYIVLRTKDRKKQQNILGAGVTFSIDTKGKKKETFRVTYPQPDMNDLSEFEHLDEANFKMRLAANEFKKISLAGFQGFPMLLGAHKNDQGVFAAISYTADGEMIYEEVIPLKLFNATADMASEWAFNIKMNGLFLKEGPMGMGGGGVAPAEPPAPSSGGGGRGGRGGGGSGPPAGGGGGMMARGGMVTQITPSSDFWGKFTLAQ